MPPIQGYEVSLEAARRALEVAEGALSRDRRSRDRRCKCRSSRR